MTFRDHWDAIDRRFAGLPQSVRVALVRAAWERFASEDVGFLDYLASGGPSLADVRRIPDRALLQQRNMGWAKLQRVHAWLAAQPVPPPTGLRPLPRWVDEE